MTTIKFTATKMSEAKVSHISLVERGANRIPFKVIKQEKDMNPLLSLDLGGLFGRSQKAEKVEPQVVAVVTMKGEGFESIKSQIEAAGFTVASMDEMEDGSVVFKQGEADIDMEDCTVVRMNDNVALVTKGFSPYNMDVTADGVTFADQCAAKGFYPGVNSIMETLSDSVRSVVYAAKTPAEAKAAVSKLFSEAAAYTSAFVAGLPQKAFKLEKMEAEAPAAGDAADGAVADEAGESAEDKVAKAAMSAEEKTHMATLEGAAKMAFMKLSPADRAKSMGSKDGDGADAEGTAGDAAKDGKKAKKDEAESLTEEKVSSIVASQVESLVTKAMGDVMEKLSGFASTFQEVQKSVAEINTGMTSITGRMDGVEQVAKAAKEAVAGTVVYGSEGGDSNPAKKSESSGYVGREIDTGFMPRVRKAGR